MAAKCNFNELTVTVLFTSLSRCPEKKVKFACAPLEDSDQTAHPRSLIRVLDERSLYSHVTNVSSVGEVRPWPDCAHAQTDWNRLCTHMPTCTFCWLPAQSSPYALCAYDLSIFDCPWKANVQKQ